MKTTIRYYWDTQIEDEHGWYYEVREDGQVREDSQKIWSLVDADDYGPEDEALLCRDLTTAYPDAVLAD